MEAPCDGLPVRARHDGRTGAAATAPASSGSCDVIATVMTSADECGGERQADVAGPDDGDVHGWILRLA